MTDRTELSAGAGAGAARQAGVDEAGRGPLAGPVVAAAVILGEPIPGLNDSKKLSARRREALAVEIRDKALAFALGQANAAEIDELNIHRATLLAMRRAVEALPLTPAAIVVDGKFVPDVTMPATAIIGGDAQVAAISAASILAKVERDAQMLRWDELYPDYGFARHKGYPTAAHLDALRRVGPCAIHRRSFAPVAQREMLDV